MTTIKNILLLIIMAIVLLFSIPIAYSWPLYSKPEFRGRIIDAETKQPIEGVVIVVLYMKWEFGGPGGGNTLPMDAKETLTDKNGEFYFPSYHTIIGPLSRTSRTDFIIFKPGYKAVHALYTTISDEKYFAIAKDMIGKEGEIKYVDDWETLRTYKGQLGIVKLKITNPQESMSGSMPNDYSEKDLPLLYRAIEEDDIIRGLLPKGGRKK